MIIKSFELEKLKSSIFNIHLIFGNNDGIKEDIINTIYLKDFVGEIFKYDETEILNNKDEFISNLLTNSLFGNKQIIIISRATEKLYPLINDILERKKIQTQIIIKSSNLEKKSKLRSIFEKDKTLICTPVYEDNVRTLNQIISNFCIYLCKSEINLIVV